MVYVNCSIIHFQLRDFKILFCSFQKTLDSNGLLRPSLVKGNFSCSHVSKERTLTCYRSGTVNSNTVNSKFHLIRSYCEYLARILSFHV